VPVLDGKVPDRGVLRGAPGGTIPHDPVAPDGYGSLSLA
jgi:hypothetical protein